MPHLKVEFQEKALGGYPGRRVLLTAYAGRGSAIKAINDVGLDYYLRKPGPAGTSTRCWDDLLDDWLAAGLQAAVRLAVVGNRWSDRSRTVRTFWRATGCHYRWLDVEGSGGARGS